MTDIDHRLAKDQLFDLFMAADPVTMAMVVALLKDEPFNLTPRRNRPPSDEKDLHT